MLFQLHCRNGVELPNVGYVGVLCDLFDRGLPDGPAALRPKSDRNAGGLLLDRRGAACVACDSFRGVTRAHLIGVSEDLAQVFKGRVAEQALLFQAGLLGLLLLLCGCLEDALSVVVRFFKPVG